MNEDGKYIEQLLDKYFGGLTSLEEEKFLRNYFRQDNIPEALEVYRSMFVFFAQEIEKEEKPVYPIHKQKPETQSTIINKNNYKRLIYRISIGVAACFLLFLGIKFTLNSTSSTSSYSQVYINGKKYTDIPTIQSEALITLENISEGSDDILSSQIDLLESFSE